MEKFSDYTNSRRSIYGISNISTISDDTLKEIISDALLHTPSAFNSQSNRILLLLGENHLKLWDITLSELAKVTPKNNFAATTDKINSFKAGYGTILYFTHTPTIRTLQEKMPLYADNFELWSHHTEGMIQFSIWTALESNGLGASLQHYNPLIDQGVRNTYNIPEDWTLVAQMPFGKPTELPGEKTYLPLEETLKIEK